MPNVKRLPRSAVRKKQCFPLAKFVSNQTKILEPKTTTETDFTPKLYEAPTKPNLPQTKAKQTPQVSTPKLPSSRRSTPSRPNFHTPSCRSDQEAKLLAFYSRFQTTLRYGLLSSGLFQPVLMLLGLYTPQTFMFFHREASSLNVNKFNVIIGVWLFSCSSCNTWQPDKTSATWNLQDNFWHDMIWHATSTGNANHDSWHLNEIICLSDNPVFQHPRCTL